MKVRLGDAVKAGDPLAEIHARTEDGYAGAAAALRDAVTVSEAMPEAHPLIYAVATREGIKLHTDEGGI